MPRTQVKYGSAGVFVGTTPSSAGGAATQLHRIQSFSDSFNLPLEDINQFGETAAIAKIANAAPTPTMEFTYYVTDGANEAALGLSGGGSIIAGILDASSDEKSYFATFSPEGQDANDVAGDFTVGLGHGFISSYSCSASIGGFMEANVSIEGSNYVVEAGSSATPAIDPVTGEPTGTTSIPPMTDGGTMPKVIKRGDIQITGLPAGLLGADLTSANIQSFSVNVDLPRQSLERLGSNYVVSRPLQTPISATVSFDFVVSELAEGNLDEIFTGCEATVFDFQIVGSPCVGTENINTFSIDVRGAYLESQNTSLDIGSDRNGSVTFTVPLGAATDVDQGIFIV